MLSLEHIDTIGGVRLVIKNDIASAWICYYPPSLAATPSHDWRLYVRHKPNQPARSGKSATRLLIESCLRSWLLQHCRRRLHDLRFADLCQIAEHKPPTPIKNARLLDPMSLSRRRVARL
jgi:hypothetical protein